jgi:hypothetical protein
MVAVDCGKSSFDTTDIAKKCRSERRLQGESAMFLDYFALGVCLLGLALVFYTFIYIHDIPYQIAKKRNHPQVDAIHLACWLSLFTLNALWPIVFVWAIMKPKPIAVSLGIDDVREQALREEIAALRGELAALKSRLDAPVDAAPAVAP